MPKRTPNNGMVGISFNLPLETLTKIQDNIMGKSQSAKIRLCVEEGYRKLTNKASKGVNPLTPPFKR